MTFWADQTQSQYLCHRASTCSQDFLEVHIRLRGSVPIGLCVNRVAMTWPRRKSTSEALKGKLPLPLAQEGHEISSSQGGGEVVSSSDWWRGWKQRTTSTRRSKALCGTDMTSVWMSRMARGSGGIWHSWGWRGEREGCKKKQEVKQRAGKKNTKKTSKDEF